MAELKGTTGLVILCSAGSLAVFIYAFMSFFFLSKVMCLRRRAKYCGIVVQRVLASAFWCLL